MYKGNIYNYILDRFNKGKKQIAVLIDPDKTNIKDTYKIIDVFKKTHPDLIFIGGSLVTGNGVEIADAIRKNTNIPLVLFPGSLLQLNYSTDAILLLSLISGRNPEFLIGNHVTAAPYIKDKGIETIPTGYILIDGGEVTSVEYMSNTKPIPATKPNIAVATALAGQMLGNKLIYLEAGSGAKNPVSKEIIESVKQNTNIPLIVGGGINNVSKLKDACDAGADIVVVGNVLEKNIDLLYQFINVIR